MSDKPIKYNKKLYEMLCNNLELMHKHYPDKSKAFWEEQGYPGVDKAPLETQIKIVTLIGDFNQDKKNPHSE